MYTKKHKEKADLLFEKSASENGLYSETNIIIDQWVSLWAHPSSAILAGNSNIKACLSLSAFFDKVYDVPLAEIKTKSLEHSVAAKQHHMNDRLEQQANDINKESHEYGYLVLTGCYLASHVGSFLESASAIISSRSVLAIDNWNDLYPQIRQGCYEHLASSDSDLEVFLVAYNRAYLCKSSSIDYYSASLPNLKDAFGLHGTDISVSRTSLEAQARHFTFFGPGNRSFDGYYGGLLSNKYEPFVQAQKIQALDINAAFVFGLDQGLPLCFHTFIELLGRIAASDSTLKSMLSTFFPIDSLPKSVQDKLECIYSAYFMSEANHIYLEAEESSFLLFVSNLSLQNDSLGFYLIDIHDCFMFCWFDSQLCDDNTASLDYIDFLKGRMDSKYFNYAGRIGLASSEAKQGMHQKAFLHVPIFSHIAHYVLNNLGPTLTLLSNSASWSNVLRIARLDYGYFTSEEECALLSMHLPHSGQPLFSYFDSVTHILDALRKNKRGYLVLHGANVPRSLSELITISDASDLLSSVDTVPSTLNLKQYSVVIGVGIRGGTRECLNLKDLVIEASRLLSEREIETLFILDGIGKSRFDSVNTTAALDLGREVSIASEIELAVNSLPKQKCISVIGRPLLAQAAALRHCHIVLTHSGSSLVKYMWLLYKPTIIHGPEHLQVKNLNLLKVGLQDVQLDFHNAFRNEAAPVYVKIDNKNISSSLSEYSPVAPGSRDNYYMLNATQVSREIIRIALSCCDL